MNIVFISSFIPRKCGLATYTKDLIVELTQQGHKAQVVVMKNEVTPSTDSAYTVGVIEQHHKQDYLNMAEKLNRSDAEIIHIQHEFGLYGGEDGEYILELARALQKPLIVTLHTVLLTPSDKQRYIIQELTRISRGVIVMEMIAQDRLENVYAINPQDISVIFHGVPDAVSLQKSKIKRQLGLEQAYVIIASNLISRNKGFEYVIGALPDVLAQIPTLTFLIVGETHPLIKLQEGESYREELEKKVKDLHLEKHVTFINKYLTLDELRMYLTASDICVTPYLEAQQITSGTLSYALGMGKACISTPYIYAEHMLAKGRGVLVPFADSTQITKAILDLYTNPEKTHRMEQKAKKLGVQMRWSNVAAAHTRLYKKVRRHHTTITSKVQKLLSNHLDTAYLEFITDQVGILQHAHYIIPEQRFGYSTDDNARALIVISSLYTGETSGKYFDLIKLYLTFLRLAQEANGQFHTFLNFQREWIDNEAITDPYGKAVWAMGYHLYRCPDSPFFLSVKDMFKTSMRHIDQIRDIRTAANTILGLYYYVSAFKGETDTSFFATHKIRKLADFLLMYYDNYQDTNWSWFEESVTYDNFRIPQALFAAFSISGEEQYKIVAEKSLAFLLTCNYDEEKEYFDFIGQNGWYQKNKTKALYDQQPVEAGGAVDAFIFAYMVTKKKDYLEKATTAFAWFFGRNRNNASLYDEQTHGIFDGLTPAGVNLNEGSESIVTFLIAWSHLKEFTKKKRGNVKKD